MRLLLCGGDGLISRLYLCFLWHICVDGWMQLSQCKGFHQNIEEIRQGILSTTTSQLAIGSIYVLFRSGWTRGGKRLDKTTVGQNKMNWYI